MVEKSTKCSNVPGVGAAPWRHGSQAQRGPGPAAFRVQLEQKLRGISTHTASLTT